MKGCRRHEEHGTGKPTRFSNRGAILMSSGIVRSGQWQNQEEYRPLIE